MSSVESYERIRADNIEALGSGDIEIDRFLATGEKDPRRGVSLIIPIEGISDAYERMVGGFSDVDPYQYYYPRSDLHVTIFDFIQARAGYESDARLEKVFLDIAKTALDSVEPFGIALRGVVFSKAAGIVKGYDDDRLLRIRGDIRRILEARGLPNDERYESRTAHATFARFRRGIANPALLRETIGEYGETALGEERVIFVELVEHDWYNSLRSKRLIDRIRLR